MHPAFAAVSGTDLEQEVFFAKRLAGLQLVGIVDLVGEGFVLDYKTDAEMHPDEHRFQLWAYATAMEKPTAYIAYLRTGELYEIDPAKLAEIGAEAVELCAAIAAGNYEATPSQSVCAVCQYSAICEFAAKDEQTQIEVLAVPATS